jgi:hypothetical protein
MIRRMAILALFTTAAATATKWAKKKGYRITVKLPKTTPKQAQVNTAIKDGIEYRSANGYDLVINEGDKVRLDINHPPLLINETTGKTIVMERVPVTAVLVHKDTNDEYAWEVLGSYPR